MLTRMISDNSIKKLTQQKIEEIKWWSTKSERG
jgi:hypothetical protein